MATHEVSSEVEPRWVTMAFSGDPVERNAMRKPFSIASRVTKTATTSPMPTDGQQRDLPALAKIADVI